MTMLFGSPTPWSSMTRIKPGQAFTPQPPAQQIPALPAPAPIAPYPTMQQPQQQALAPTPPAAPGADLAYSNNLAQQYASQLQNQSIPGGYQPAPMAQPAAQAPVYSQTPVPQPPQQQQAPHPMDAFHSMIQAWQAQHPQHVAGQNWQTQKSAWQALRPQKGSAIG